MYKLILLLFLMSVRNVLCISNNDVGSMTSVITSSNVASVSFYQTIAKGNENVLFCPLSLNILLALATTAAGGDTAKELRSALHLNIKNEDIESGYKELLENLKDNNLKIATRMFPNITVYILPQFIKLARNVFNSDIELVNYRDPATTARIINTFVEKNTNNKIHDIVDARSLTEDTFLILVNAVHFKDDWKYKFKSQLVDRNFYLSKDKEVKTKMMEVTSNYEYAAITSLDARVLQIPYQEKGYSMLIILPNKIDGLHDVENKLNVISFEEILNNLNSKYVQLTLPKFKMEETLNLGKVCEQLGIKSMFKKSMADLSGLSNNSVYVSNIVQKTYIKVDEKGVEAAAATIVSGFSMHPHLEIPLIPIVFTADHPFIFVLMKGKMVLFLGRLCQI